ncbi:DUF2334 domain-containing protein [Salibacterium sp. K-3]
MYKWMVLMVSVWLLLGTSPVSAEKGDEPEVLLVYSSSSQEQMKEVRMLDALIGQFSSDITWTTDENLRKKEVDSYSHLVYYGGVQKQLPQRTIHILNNYQGKIYAAGHNADQLTKQFSFLQWQGKKLIQRVSVSGTGTTLSLPEERIVYEVQTNGKASVTAESGESPVAVHSGDRYYFSGETVSPPLEQVVSESLTSFFDDQHENVMKYLRLEDIDPLSDPEVLRKQAEYLAEKNIPYLVALIPVYTNEEGETIHLTDSPQLVETLQYMQDNGASIVLHGYKHQYRHSETGEGFEFWDVKHDRPIFQPASEKGKVRRDFESEKAYRTYKEDGTAFERQYIKDAITSGIRELTAHNLYPLAFEAPHYAMSQQGYEMVSHHFSSYVGQLQLTDNTWQSQDAPTYESQPSFLHGMTVYPETLGYIEKGEQASFERMKEEIGQRSTLTKSYLSAFYHPYLGLEGLKKIVQNLEAVEGAAWLNLKDRQNTVRAGDIRITSKNGKIEVDKPVVTGQYEQKLVRNSALRYGTVPVLVLFIAAAIFIRKRRHKRRKEPR